MKELQTIWDYLQGKKTYLTAGGMIIYAVVGYSLKQLTSQQEMSFIWQALALVGLRSALFKLP